MIVKKNPSIGILIVGHRDYPNDLGVEFAIKAANELKQRGVSVEFNSKALTSAVDASKEANSLAKKDIDGVIVFLGTWIESSTALAAIRMIEHLPFAIWGFPMFINDRGKYDSTGSLVSFAVLKGALDRVKYRYKAILGPVGDQITVEKAVSFSLAASVWNRLRQTRIGLVGYTSMSMYPGNFDHLLLRRHIGPEVVHFDIYSIIERTKKIKDVDCISLIDALNNKAKVSNRINKSDLFICIKMFLALKQIVEDHKLDAVNVKCQYELSQEFGMTACLPISLMAEEGIVAACEGDIIITTSMVIFNYFTDQKIFYGDIVDIKDNVIWLSSCGAAPFSLADRSKDVFINNFDSFFEDLRGYKKAEPSLREVNPFRGLMNSFVLKPGELTVGCLIEGVGEYKFIAVRGLGLESELRQEFFPGIEIEIQGDMDRFIDNIPSQHFTFCYGDMIDPLKDLCGILGIEFLQF